MTVTSLFKNNLSENILLNYEDNMHYDAISMLFLEADCVDIVVAFLKMSGMIAIGDALIKHLKLGKKARFLIGSDFYITDPAALLFLLDKSREYDLECLLVDKSEYSFHPKVYAFRNENVSKIVIGSANLTAGGLSDNYEVSVIVEDEKANAYEKIEYLIDDLKSSGQASPLSDDLVADYTNRHKIFRASIDLGIARAKRLMSNSSPPLELLEARLIEMKADQSFQGFEQQRTHRAKLYRESSQAFEALMGYDGTEDGFLQCYKAMIGKWTSTGNLRLAKEVARHHATLRIILGETRKLIQKKSERGVIIDYLNNRAKGVKGFGTNAITEVLHCIDAKNFAVMNQNSIYGLSFGSDTRFPHKPNKNNTNGYNYNKFCIEAERIIDALSLSSFSELDSLFSYIYFID